jgi:hypothetical protein
MTKLQLAKQLTEQSDIIARLMAQLERDKNIIKMAEDCVTLQRQVIDQEKSVNKLFMEGKPEQAMLLSRSISNSISEAN